MSTSQEDYIDMLADGFDLEREELSKPGSYVIFLQRDGRTSIWKELIRFDSGFMARVNTFRNKLQVDIATKIDLTDILFKSAAFAYNDRVYPIDEGDAFPPTDDRLAWMIYGSVLGKEKYTPA